MKDKTYLVLGGTFPEFEGIDKIRAIELMNYAKDYVLRRLYADKHISKEVFIKCLYDYHLKDIEMISELNVGKD